jgi:anti-anti-sigma factor
MSDEAELSPGDVLCVEAKYDGTEAAIVLVGEVDMTSVEVFWAHVSEAVEARPVAITVEARGLTFVDSSGLMALARARDAASEAGATFRVREPSPPLRRIAELCGLEGLLLLDGTPDAGPPPDP